VTYFKASIVCRFVTGDAKT